MSIFGLTDVGKKRDNNQDCFEILYLSDTSSLIVVCDGMGGANGGSVASTVAKDTIINRVRDSYRENMNQRAVKNALESAITAANIKVFDKSVSDETLSGMGTTTVVVLIVGENAYIAHVGDSRAYLIDTKTDSIEQITTDHSIVQMMVESGQITSSEAKVHPKRNIITRAVGVNDDVKVDFVALSLTDANKLLVCTDGLTNFVSNDKILEIAEHNKAGEAVKLLIEEANRNGGSDNITAVIAE